MFICSSCYKMVLSQLYLELSLWLTFSRNSFGQCAWTWSWNCFKLKLFFLHVIVIYIFVQSAWAWSWNCFKFHISFVCRFFIIIYLSLQLVSKVFETLFVQQGSLTPSEQLIMPTHSPCLSLRCVNANLGGWDHHCN